MEMPSVASLPLAPIETYRLSPQQRYSWRLQDAVRWPNAQIVLQLDGTVDPYRLAAALTVVCERHEALRTSFRRAPGMALPLRVVNVACTPSWRCVDLQHLEPNTQDVQALEHIVSDYRAPFVLQNDPVLRCLLIDLDRDQHLISFTLPAISADRHSLRNLVREFSLIYSKQCESLDPEPLQYSEIAQWQDELIQSDDQHARDGLALWRKWVDNVPEHHELPFQLLDTTDCFEQATHTLELKLPLIHAVDNIAMQSGVKPSTVFETLWAIVLSRFTGAGEIVIGHECDGRASAPELEGALGLLAKTLPIHLNVDLTTPLSLLLREVDSAIRDALRWKEYYSC